MNVVREDIQIVGVTEEDEEHRERPQGFCLTVRANCLRVIS